ncbi:MAG: M15 family metallopeptidase [Clostridia bacterium]|nr:M15 family metallopeptidase [Clostridia bacterium]
MDRLVFSNIPESAPESRLTEALPIEPGVDMLADEKSTPTPLPIQKNNSSNAQIQVNSTERIESTSHIIAGDLLLVNKWNPLSSGFIPDELKSLKVDSSNFLIPSKDTDTQLKRHVLDAAVKMYNSSLESGIKDIVISSGYRSYKKQNYFFTKKVNQLKKMYPEKEALKEASTVVAVPGTSEHQTGLAIDLTTSELLKLKKSDPLDASFAQTPAGKWAKENSWKFGFILRYLADKTHITGIIGESWHFRYTGLPHSQIIYENNFCLEEYLDYIKIISPLKYIDYTGTSYEISFVSHYKVNVSDDTSICDVSGDSRNGYIVTKKLD